MSLNNSNKDTYLNRLNGKCWAFWDTLHFFVLDVCGGRDESHGHQHMEKVAINALTIFFDMYKEITDETKTLVEDIIITAWLHDVADHKYDKNGKLQKKLEVFLSNILLKNKTRVDLIMNIIDRISFSKENNLILQNKPTDWKDVLGKYGCLIRDIVSDADKLEAIGKIGIQRCIKYNKEHNKDIQYDTLVNGIKIHAKEKLLRLKDEFIRTEPGKKMAEPLHLELIEELKKL